MHSCADAVIPIRNTSAMASPKNRSINWAGSTPSTSRPLGVISRTSVMRYRNTTNPIRAIAKELGVSFVLEGSARWEGGRVRVNAQLIQVSDQTHLWTETYERESRMMFAVQSEITRKVARSLALELHVPNGVY